MNTQASESTENSPKLNFINEEVTQWPVWSVESNSQPKALKFKDPKKKLKNKLSNKQKAIFSMKKSPAKQKKRKI